MLATVFVFGGLVYAIFNPAHRRRTLQGPVGCLAIPVIAIVLLIAVLMYLKKSDADLFEEVFGYRPTITEDRMLFFHSGRDESREIYMRAEPTDAERKALLATAKFVKSTISLAYFNAQSDGKELWWVSTNPDNDSYCKSARISVAEGFRGWEKLYIAECLDAGTDIWKSSNTKYVYVIAMRQ